MRVVVTSLLGLSLLSSMAWAVETAPAPSVAPAVPATTAAPVQVQGSTTQPKIIPAVATVSPTGQPQEAKPLTAEQLAKNKALQDAKVKALVKDQASRLAQLEKANLDAFGAKPRASTQK